MNSKQMESALRLIGYSHHSGLPRFGPKAQIARWGLGEDDFPKSEMSVKGLEPLSLSTADFESAAYTNSATPTMQLTLFS